MSDRTLARLGAGTWQLRGHHIRFYRGDPRGWTVGACTYEGVRDHITDQWLNEMGLRAAGEPVSFDSLQAAVRATVAAMSVSPLQTRRLAEVKLLRRGGEYETVDGRWTVRRDPGGGAAARWQVAGPRRLSAPTLAYARAKIAKFHARERAQADRLAAARQRDIRQP